MHKGNIYNFIYICNLIYILNSMAPDLTHWAFKLQFFFSSSSEQLEHIWTSFFRG